MSFNFNELLLQGKSAAEDVIRNKSEVAEVLKDLETSLNQFLEIPIKLKEYIGYIKNDNLPFSTVASLLKPKEKTGYNEVHIVSEQVNFSKEVFQLKRSDDIYPITIVRGLHHSVANNQSEFASEMGQIASNSQFHLQLNSFKSQVEKILKEKIQELPESK